MSDDQPFRLAPDRGSRPHRIDTMRPAAAGLEVYATTKHSERMHYDTDGDTQLPVAETLFSVEEPRILFHRWTVLLTNRWEKTRR